MTIEAVIDRTDAGKQNEELSKKTDGGRFETGRGRIVINTIGEIDRRTLNRAD
jgi:hypothetical protein